MSFLIKDAVGGSLIESIYNEIFSRRSNYYYFIGKVLAWDDPSNPDDPLNTQYYEYETRNKILSAKKVQFTDVSFVIPRVNWQAGTVYDQFDGNYSVSFPAPSGAESLKGSLFYVLNSSFNVYKCISNNNEVASTVEPTGNDPTPNLLDDGYIWKYMYTIPISLRNRFLTNELMPVQKSVYNTYYSSGEVDRIIIDSKGSGYFGNSEVSLQVNGTFLNNVGNVEATIIPVFDVAGSIQSVVIRNAGNNYKTANITIVDNAGSGSSFYKGLKTVTITNPGSGYTAEVVANTTANVTTSGTFQPNANAAISLTFNNNSLVAVSIVDAGYGYFTDIAANSVFEITTTGAAQPTTNASATLTFSDSAVLTPVLYQGRIHKVLINDPGLGYRSNIQTSISAIGDGSNVSLLPFINESGELEEVIILSRGEGYTYLDLEVFGDGSGANVFADLSTGDLDTLQSTVELSAIDGALYNFRIHDSGANYTVATMSVTGDGNGFVGTVNLSNSGTVSSITVNNPGRGYTYANVIISGDGSNANVSAIISPPGGHGRDAVKELFANTIMFYSTVNNEKIHNKFVNNDYRQFGLIRNLEQFGNERKFANNLGTPTYLVTLDTLTDSTTATLAADTVLTLRDNLERRFEVVEVYTDNTQALLTNLNNFSLTSNSILYDPSTDSSFIVRGINSSPTINKFSGDLLFIDNRTKVSYSDQQLVTLRTTFKL